MGDSEALETGQPHAPRLCQKTRRKSERRCHSEFPIDLAAIHGLSVSRCGVLLQELAITAN